MRNFLSDNTRCDLGSQMRQSFDERVCDDLAEVILQFLPIEDKLRLRCVSTQFSRTILTKETYFSVRSYLGSKDWEEKVDFVLKKCPNIIFNFNEHYFHEQAEFDRFIDLIIANCNELSHLGNIHQDMIDENLNKLIKKYGQMLKYVEFNSHSSSLQLMLSSIKATNIEKVVVVNRMITKLCELRFNRLKSLEVRYLENKDFNDFKVFIGRNGERLKHLSIICGLSDEQHFHLLDIITKCPNLVHLSIRYLPLVTDKFEKHLRGIANECIHLKSLEINQDLNLNDIKDNHFLSTLKHFKQLKRLDLTFEIKENLSKYTLTDLFTFAAFEGLHDLTHLNIRIRSPEWYIPMDFPETFLEGIDTYLPRLQSLTYSGIELRLSRASADILCRLSRLETIDLQIINKQNIAEFIETKLREKCPKIRSIKLKHTEGHKVQIKVNCKVIQGVLIDGTLYRF